MKRLLAVLYSTLVIWATPSWAGPPGYGWPKDIEPIPGHPGVDMLPQIGVPQAGVTKKWTAWGRGGRAEILNSGVYPTSITRYLGREPYFRVHARTWEEAQGLMIEENKRRPAVR